MASARGKVQKLDASGWEGTQELESSPAGAPQGGEMSRENFRDLFIMQLQDLYDAEQQILKALPKMIKRTSSGELKQALQQHLEETKQHPQRLERVLDSLQARTKGAKCKGMQGLLAEGSAVLAEGFVAEVLDAGIIASAQRVEHYEIAGYGCARTFAELLGLEDAVAQLNETLEEEKAADQKLTAVSEPVNSQAASATSAEDTERPPRPKGKARAAKA
jgi:ferritin-like metal-binding protein YciE